MKEIEHQSGLTSKQVIFVQFSVFDQIIKINKRNLKEYTKPSNDDKMTNRGFLEVHQSTIAEKNPGKADELSNLIDL